MIRPVAPLPVTITTPVNNPGKPNPGLTEGIYLMVKILLINIRKYSNININKQTTFKYGFGHKSTPYWPITPTPGGVIFHL
jgi:hypothetical protein